MYAVFCLILVAFVLIQTESVFQKDYYSNFQLDYGAKEVLRDAGRIRGFLNPDVLLEHAQERDYFFKWVAKKLALGHAESDSVVGRLKPYYAVDIGTKFDRNGTNPKVIIINNHLQTNENQEIISATKEIDYEVREIWQPWLKHRCNFTIRYIVPNRINILRIMEKKGQVKTSVELPTTENGHNFTPKLIFRPASWISKFLLKKSSEYVVPLKLKYAEVKSTKGWFTSKVEKKVDQIGKH